MSLSPSIFPQFESATSFAAIDFETASDRLDSAVSIGVVHCGGPHPHQAFYSLIRPKRPSDRFTAVHGISVKTQKIAPSFESVWPRIVASLGRKPILFAHNAAFDRRILRGMLATSQMQGPPVRFYCTLRMARQLWPGLPCDLHSVATRLKIQVEESHHALTDALVVAEVVLKIRDLVASS